jgi:hypothetical protein
VGEKQSMTKNWTNIIFYGFFFIFFLIFSIVTILGQIYILAFPIIMVSISFLLFLIDTMGFTIKGFKSKFLINLGLSIGSMSGIYIGFISPIDLLYIPFLINIILIGMFLSAIFLLWQDYKKS